MCPELQSAVCRVSTAKETLTAASNSGKGREFQRTHASSGELEGCCSLCYGPASKGVLTAAANLCPGHAAGRVPRVCNSLDGKLQGRLVSLETSLELLCLHGLCCGFSPFPPWALVWVCLEWRHFTFHLRLQHHGASLKVRHGTGTRGEIVERRQQVSFVTLCRPKW